MFLLYHMIFDLSRGNNKMLKELILMTIFITISFSIISACIYIAIERLKDPNYYKNEEKDNDKI